MEKTPPEEMLRLNRHLRPDLTDEEIIALGQSIENDIDDDELPEEFQEKDYLRLKI